MLKPLTTQIIKDQIDFFLKTQGCYVISTECSLLLAYRCSVPYHIDVEGDNIFIQYMLGDLSEMMNIPCNADKVYYDRRGKLKMIKYGKIIKKFK